MLKTNFLPKAHIRQIMKKIIILNIIIYIFMGILMPNVIQAAQVKYTYTEGKLANYPGYEELIKTLQTKHPTWNFTILETGLDWNEVIKNETVASHGRNLIYHTYSGSWVCSVCGEQPYDSGKWKCASETSVAYYMDPRNWINEENIFQFENLSYNGEVQNVDGVKKILNNVKWANAEQITYTKPDGTTATLEKSYADVIMEAAAEAGISPYHLAARIKQEQGAKETASSTGCGTYKDYVGYYNFLNIKATGSNIIGNALSHAKKEGWDDPEKSIKGGAKFIATDYINRGQTTLYLQKFDVDNQEGSLYYHQYMQNVSAALTEGNTVKSSYESMELLDSNLSFVIPVYENMPQEISPSPDGITLVTQNVKVKGDNVIVRDASTTSANEIVKVNKDDILLRIEISGIKSDGYYWDKVVLADGTKGYIARDFIEKINNVTNANLSAVANVNVNLRNGPGTAGTKVITTLTAGQSVTVIETGKYDGLDDYNWSRVKLSNGTEGYLANNYITEVSETNYIIAYVDCDEGSSVKIRKGIGTNNTVVTSVKKDTKVTVLERDTGKANGYDWDKIVTSDGIEGYIANTYLKYEGEEELGPEPERPNSEFKVEEKVLTSEPETTVADVKAKYPDAVVKNGETVLGDENLIGTGNIVVIDSFEYTVVKLGDVSGDGSVDSRDSLRILKYSVGTYEIKDGAVKASDINLDGNIDARDSLRILKYSVGTYEIKVQ